MKVLTNRKIWLFAIGQFGWALLSGLISNFLVYFYQPDESFIEKGMRLFIPQGRIFLGAATVCGLITAFGRLFDAVTDPFIAAKSDSCKSKEGRRLPFLKWSAIPLGISTLSVFMAPINEISSVNVIWLFLFITVYYLALTAYCTPYTALIPELGHTQKERLSISTAISLTYILGIAVAYIAPSVWEALSSHFERVIAIRITFSVLSAIGTVSLFVPVLAIKEKDYVDIKPSNEKASVSLLKTFKNKEFRIFVASDILYWIAVTMFQTGLPFFVTILLRLEESMSTVLFVMMTALSLVFYIPINKFAIKLGKKKLVCFAFFVFTIAYIYTSLCGKLPLPPMVQGIILVILTSLPIAIFGILPQAIVADISQSDSIKTNENREGMFYAARTFSFKLGQSLSMILFTSLSTVKIMNFSDAGYRLIAILCGILCLLGGIILIFYNEKKVTEINAKASFEE